MRPIFHVKRLLIREAKWLRRVNSRIALVQRTDGHLGSEGFKPLRELRPCHAAPLARAVLTWKDAAMPDFPKTATPRGPLVLGIEGDELLCRMLVTALEQGGFRVFWLESGEKILTTPRSALMKAAFELVGPSFNARLTGP